MAVAIFPLLSLGLSCFQGPYAYRHASQTSSPRHNSWKHDVEKIGFMNRKDAVNLDRQGITGELAKILYLVYVLVRPLSIGKLTCFLDHSLNSLRIARPHFLHFDWTKKSAISLWSVGDDFDNVMAIASHATQEARDPITLARTCGIHSPVKLTLYALTFPSFGIDDQERLLRMGQVRSITACTSDASARIDLLQKIINH
ncbi:hypothetical protein BDN72DRAFT_842905 [Pluteus cervinus]|uniref:Uncharacterized protein n=1 Tax=Pluteus cervinus TaxID=181527 RepID=A0ACD3AP98_9AGAR|nr:hypothetical protein BDN72DRAFT_842905 [Pluteus cervinus]